MPYLPLRIGSTPLASKADFGVIVDEGSLWVPRDLGSALQRLAVGSAEELVAMVDVFPSAIANELKWDLADVARAREGLTGKLRGLVDDALLQPTIERSPPLGARNPWER